MKLHETGTSIVAITTDLELQPDCTIKVNTYNLQSVEVQTSIKLRTLIRKKCCIWDKFCLVDVLQ